MKVSFFTGPLYFPFLTVWHLSEPLSAIKCILIILYYLRNSSYWFSLFLLKILDALVTLGQWTLLLNKVSTNRKKFSRIVNVKSVKTNNQKKKNYWKILNYSYHVISTLRCYEKNNANIYQPYRKSNNPILRFNQWHFHFPFKHHNSLFLSSAIWP